MAGLREHSVGDLFRELAGEIRFLFREEVELARTELTQKAGRAAKDAVALATGGVMLFTGFLLMLACAVAAISTVLPVWLSALATGAFFSIAGGLILVLSIGDVKRGKLKPGRTIDSLKKTGDTLKEVREELPLLKTKKTEAQKPTEAQKKIVVTSSAPASNGKKMDEIQQEMDSARSGMHRTIDELQQKLSPSHLAEEAGKKIRKTTSGLAEKMTAPAKGKTGKVGSKVVTVLKENPLPVFVAGVGISWLITKGAQHKRQED
ncbi:MAG: phage holin family protein [Nitrospiraceae bacterium]|nr:phage holin family protein [Nitrospiraceae bacterium]